MMQMILIEPFPDSKGNQTYFSIVLDRTLLLR